MFTERFREHEYGFEPDSNWDDPDEEVVESQFDDWDESAWEMSEGK